jgi:hypothetical protein
MKKSNINDLLQQLFVATISLCAVVGNGSLAEDIEFKKNPNNLQECPSPDLSRDLDIERHASWTNCWGKYIFQRSEKVKGLIIEAEFFNGRPNGIGRFMWKNGAVYIGSLKDGRKSGKGTFIFENGDKYIGDWKDDKRHGLGEHHYLASKEYRGDKFIGEYKNDVMSGRGIYTKRDGRIFEGIWESGALIHEQKVYFDEKGRSSPDVNMQHAQRILDDIVTHEIDSKRFEIQNKRELLKREEEILRAQEKRLAERSLDVVMAKIEQEFSGKPVPSRRINLEVSNTQPSSDGDVEITIRTNIDTASLTIDGEEQGGKKDGEYLIKRVARIGQTTQFTIVAKDVYGNAETKKISVTREAARADDLKYAPLNPSLVTKQRQKDAVAIIIGIAEYKNLPKAEYANDDARIFYDYAMRALGIKPENVKLLVDADADQAEIYQAFKTWLPSRVRSTTDVYVYYSGHGLPEANGQEFYLLPQRAHRDLVEETAISQSKINAAIQAAKPRSVTVFLDSCYSGMARTGETLLASARPLALKADKKLFPAEFAVIAASQADQISSSSPDLKHGIFSYYLMKGMEGDADADSDGKITLGEMQRYLIDNVGRQAGMMNRKQEPQLIGDANRVLVGR